MNAEQRIPTDPQGNERRRRVRQRRAVLAASQAVALSEPTALLHIATVSSVVDVIETTTTLVARWSSGSASVTARADSRPGSSATITDCPTGPSTPM